MLLRVTNKFRNKTSTTKLIVMLRTKFQTILHKTTYSYSHNSEELLVPIPFFYWSVVFVSHLSFIHSYIHSFFFRSQVFLPQGYFRPKTNSQYKCCRSVWPWRNEAIISNGERRVTIRHQKGSSVEPEIGIHRTTRPHRRCGTDSHRRKYVDARGTIRRC